MVDAVEHVIKFYMKIGMTLLGTRLTSNNLK